MFNKLFKPFLESLPENNKLERIWILAKTDFKKRYYGTSLGIVWALINPIVQLLIFYYVFTVFFKSEIKNFPLYIFLGLIIWMFFAETTKKGMHTIHANRYLLENIRINKYDIFSSGMLSNLMALSFNLIVFFAISFLFNISYNLNMLYLPLLIINLLILILGLNLILSIIYIYLRDFDHFWDIFMIAAFWVNPIVYSEHIMYEHNIVLRLNPIAGIIINSHNTLLYGKPIDLNLFIWDFIYAFVILIIGILIFNKYSKRVIEIL
jgi:ABC-type polysaccharide/polyol phosphate export permease